jgi:hypothetical protein
MKNRDANAVLARLRQTMDGLTRLLESLDKPPAGQYRDTVARIAVEGRAVTNVAQNLKHCFEGFEEWYGKCQKEMGEDQLCKFFYRLRTDKLKKGDDHISSFSLSNLKRGFNLSIIGGNVSFSYQSEAGEHITKVITPPDNSTGCFIDSNGIGWNVLAKDGTTARCYAEVPMHQIGIDLWFDSPPQMHRGKVITDASVENLCRLYVEYLREFVKLLEAEFYAK